jgi:hypothetical protein
LSAPNCRIFFRPDFLLLLQRSIDTFSCHADWFAWSDPTLAMYRMPARLRSSARWPRHYDGPDTSAAAIRLTGTLSGCQVPAPALTGLLGIDVAVLRLAIGVADAERGAAQNGCRPARVRVGCGRAPSPTQDRSAARPTQRARPTKETPAQEGSRETVQLHLPHPTAAGSPRSARSDRTHRGDRQPPGWVLPSGRRATRP